MAKLTDEQVRKAMEMWKPLADDDGGLIMVFAKAITLRDLCADLLDSRADGEKMKRRIKELERGLNDIMGLHCDYTSPEVYHRDVERVARAVLKGERHEQG